MEKVVVLEFEIGQLVGRLAMKMPFLLLTEVQVQGRLLKRVPLMSTQPVKLSMLFLKSKVWLVDPMRMLMYGGSAESATKLRVKSPEPVSPGP